MKVNKLWVGILIYINNLTSWAKKKVASKHCPKGANWPQRLDLSWQIADLTLDVENDPVLTELWPCEGPKLKLGKYSK